MTSEPGHPAEEAVVEELLAGRSDPNELLRPVGGDSGDREVRRECLEVLGLLASSLEPKTPPADLKARLMAEIEESGATAPFESARPAADRGADPAARAAAAGSTSDGPLVPRVERRPRRPWLLPVAAALAFLGLGLAAWESWRAADLRRVNARQAAALEAARADLARLGGGSGALERAEAKLALLTSTGSEYCPLEPGRDSRMRRARGTLVMHPDAERWFLKVVGLEPSTEGFRYQLWYLTEEGPVAAVSFGFDSGDGVVEAMPERGPEGVQAIMITLEPAGSEAPSSPALLYGDERRRIL